MATVDAFDVVALIADIFHRRGADSYLGENVTMSQHMLQAAHLAEQSKAEEIVVAAALLHDIGHYTSEFPADAHIEGNDNFHEQAGARVLQPWFPDRLIECVRNHVPAKRYLCATRADYYDDLSDASKYSLELQGGPMNQRQVEQFHENIFLEDILQVRIWDDLAKCPDTITPGFAHYQPILEKLVLKK